MLRGDDPEAIHDIRVASRRLQQVLVLLYPAPAREIRRVRRRIRRCRRALSEVRNCDVLIQRVEKSLLRKRTTRREAWESVRDYLRERRSQSYLKALRKLGKLNLASLYVSLKVHLAPNGTAPDFRQPGPLDPGTNDLAVGQFYERVTEALASLWQDFETQITESLCDPKAPALHSVRISAKRLRYLIEVVREFNVPGSREALVWLRRLQRHLGDWHDLEVMEQMMTEMVARPGFVRHQLDIATQVMKLIKRNRAAKRNYQGKYLGMTSVSAAYPQTKEWVGYLLSSPSAAFATV